MRYRITSSEKRIKNYAVWRIIDTSVGSDNVVSNMFGPSSLITATACCAAMNGDNFNKDHWIESYQKYGIFNDPN